MPSAVFEQVWEGLVKSGEVPKSQHLSVMPAVPTLPIWRLSVAQYHQMIQASILDEDDLIELLEGWLVFKVPKSPLHCVSIGLLRDALARLPSDFFVESHGSLTTEDGEPEPDLMVVRGTPGDYSNRHPCGADVALVVEVADSSLTRDREQKRGLYARAGVPVYWIINLSENQVEVYSAIGDEAEQVDYLDRQDFLPADEVPLLLDGREIGRLRVSELLP
jgi:Uma2 family endonuclease